MPRPSVDLSAGIAARVAECFAERRPLAIRGAGTRAAWLPEPYGESLDVVAHAGLVSYEPSELVVTARTGTPLAELEAELARHGQMLAFEPPRPAPGATLGGAIATGWSGPRRAWAGAARDFVLGVRCVNGRGELLRFGGQVMKNVAGYDVSRLMTGACGTLGVLLEVSLKVLPRPEREITVARVADEAEAIRLLAHWGAQPVPLSASCWHDGELRVRLSGSALAVRAAAARIGGDEIADDDGFWDALRDQTAPFFRREGRLWRFSLPPATPQLALPGAQLAEWGGALRWLWSDADAASLQAAVASAGGHATLHLGALPGEARLPSLSAPLLALHRRIRAAFDPAGILNAGQLYAEH